MRIIEDKSNIKWGRFNFDLIYSKIKERNEEKYQWESNKMKV